jgi:hypothetical protein
MPTPDAKEHWEEHYVERDRVWSRRVNARLSVDPGAQNVGQSGGLQGAVDLSQRGRRPAAARVALLTHTPENIRAPPT